MMTSYYSYLGHMMTRQYLLIIVEKAAKASSSDKYTEQLSQITQDVFHIHYLDHPSLNYQSIILERYATRLMFCLLLHNLFIYVMFLLLFTIYT